VTSTDDYFMGRTADETDRLMLQARVLAPHSMHLLRLAGITRGMHVLDVGCGAGDISMLLAEIVGPRGTVIGVDMNPAILDVARARAARAGLPNVSFIQADLTSPQVDDAVGGPADALVGRLILLHLKDPAATVKELSRLIRPGGLVTFQEYRMTRSRAIPATPLTAQCVDWIVAAVRSAGGDPDLGERVAVILSAAGLTVVGAAAAAPAGTADSDMPEYLTGTIRTLLPAVLAHTDATEALIDLDTLTDRITRELKEAGATFWSAELGAAWARVGKLRQSVVTPGR
jgi:cyclopropane fatty-acyl-phospholipid synthase-like methyltransferase